MLLQKVAQLAGMDVPHPKQHERWFRCPFYRENTREIQVVRHDDFTSLPCMQHQCLVARRLQTEIANVSGWIA